jgi:membrane associated rhomboid family serine protease
MITRGRHVRFGARLTPAVKWLLGLTVAVFAVFMLGGRGLQATLVDLLVLTPGALLDLEVWKLATTVFFTTSPVAFLIDCLVLWFFMPFLERSWGTRRFLIFGAVTTLTANVVSTLVGLAIGGPALAAPIAGLTPFMYAGMIGYGVAYAEQPISFFGVIPMKGKTLAIGMAAVVILAAVLGRNWVQGSGHIAAMVAAFLMTSGRITPRLWILKWRRDRIRRRYKVLDGGAGKDHKWLN